MAKAPVWNYILVFGKAVGERKEVTDFLESRPEIISWYAPLSNAVFIRSEMTANALTKVFREFTRDNGRFIILDCETDKNGWLPENAWKFMRNEFP